MTSLTTWARNLFGILSLLIVCSGCKTSSKPVSRANLTNSSTGLTSSANPSAFGSPITFTATVVVTDPFGRRPGSGQVLFEDGANILVRKALNLAGTAEFVEGDLSIGTHSITAVYQGSGTSPGSTSAPVVEVIGPQPGVPVLETVRIPKLAGATTADRVTSLSYSGVFFVQPADSLEFRLRIPWPTTLQVLVNEQQLQQIQPGDTSPQPDDPGYFNVKATPMPGWPDKIDPSAPGYNWFFVLAYVKLPKQFRYQNETTPVPGFTVTLRDLSLGGQIAAADVNLPMLPYPRPPFGIGVATPPSTFFLSGENSKDDGNFARATDGIVAGWHAADPKPNFVSTVTLAGWLTQDGLTVDPAKNARGPAAGSGRSEDWQFDLWLDPDFVQRNYSPASLDSPPFVGPVPEPLASGVIPGQPENQVNLDACHQIQLVLSGTDVGTFLMPGTGLMTVELNAWHTDPGPPSGRGPAPSGYWPDPNPTSFPNNAWAFPVCFGTVPASVTPDKFKCFEHPAPADSPHTLAIGDYVIVTGTLWEDIGHVKSDPVQPNNVCWEDALACQGGWMEIHPVDVVRFVSPPPALRRQPNLIEQCAYPGGGNFQSSVIDASNLPHDEKSVLRFQEVPDSRFTDPNTVVQKQIQIDPCDPTKIDANLETANPNGFGMHKSVVETWWEPGTTPRPQPDCPPKTFNFLEISITRRVLSQPTGSVGTLSMAILKPDQTALQTVALKDPGTSLPFLTISNNQSIALNSPQGLTSFGSFVLTATNCITGFNCDAWQIQDISIRAFNTTNGQINGAKTDQLCVFSDGGRHDWQTLTKISPTLTLSAFTNCATLPPQCQPGFTPCSGTCVNLNTDPDNCGSCGNGCSAEQKCAKGKCIAKCPPGTQLCCGGDLGCRKPGQCPAKCP